MPGPFRGPAGHTGCVPSPGVCPPQEVRAYAALVTDKLSRIPGVRVFAAYVHGSAALGGWHAKVSDVDILVLLAENVDPCVADALARTAASTIPGCPGTGLEMSVVCRSDAMSPRPPWRFVVHVAGGGEGQPNIVLADGHPGDPDLLLHYVACQAAGWTVTGPLAGDAVGPVSRRALLEALATELAWGLEHAAAQYALLNACRSLTYLSEKRLVAKTTGGQWALDHGVGPADGIRRALAAQAGGSPVEALTDVEVDFIERAVLLLSAAAEDRQVDGMSQYR